MIYPNFIGPTYTGLSYNAAVEYCLNLYPEVQESPGAKSRMVYYGAPGTALWNDFGEGPIRGMLEMDDYAFIVSGPNVFVVDPLGVITNIGTVSNDGMPVSMSANPTQLFIVAGGVGYIVVGGAVTPIPGFPPTNAVDGGYLDTFFIALNDDGLPNGGQIFISDAGDGLVWDAADFTTVDASANKLIAIAIDHQELWVFGTLITQVFYNSGGLFPFVPNQSGVLNVGIAAKKSVAQMDNTLYWLSKDKDGRAMIVKASGYVPARVSTHAVEQAIQKYGDVSDAIAWTFQMNGHTFYHINFPSANASWRYDAASGLWHEVGWLNSATGKLEQHRGASHIFKGGKHLIGDRESGKVWELSELYYDDASLALRSVRRAPVLSIENRRLRFSMLELDVEPGVGLDVASDVTGYDPQVMMRYSNDSGHTWSSERLRSVGRQGQYGKRVRWLRCGSGRNRVFEVSQSDPVKRCWTGAFLEMN